MTIIRNLALALLLAFAGSTAAHAQEAKVGDWEIYKHDENCAAASSFEDGTIAIIGYFKDQDQATLMILDDTLFADVKDREPLKAGLMFVNNPVERKLETRWTSLPVAGAVLNSGKHGALIMGPGAMLDTFAGSEFFALINGEDVMVSLKFARGPEVIAALRDCTAKL